MQTIQIIKGATAPTDARVYTVSPEGKAMANIPGWVVYLDPAYVKTTERTALNRVQYKSEASTVDTTGSIAGMPIGTFPNGSPAFSPTDSSFIRLDPKIAFPQDNWSVVFVAQSAARATTENMSSIVTGNTYSSNTALFSPKVALSSNGTSIGVLRGGAIQNEASYRLSKREESMLTAPSVFVVTGSSKNGLKIFKDNVLIAESDTAAAKTPLNNQCNPGEWNILRGARGLFGAVGVLSIDLGDTANEEYRNRINTFLYEKYVK